MEYNEIPLPTEAPGEEPVPTVESNAELFGKFVEEVNKNKALKPLNMGFPILQQNIIAALSSGLIALGAAPSAGKTAFIMQAAYSIATQSGRDVLIFALEMSRNELIARDLSRLTYQLGEGRTAAELLRGSTFDSGVQVDFTKKQQEIITKAATEYKALAGKHIYIFESTGELKASDVDRIARKFTKDHGAAPVIFLDYLQLLSPEDPRADERRGVTQSVILFKNLSRDLQTPVFVISATARTNYYNSDPEGFGKESGTLEYSADTTLFMQYAACYEEQQARGDRDKAREEAAKAAAAADNRDIVISIIKNRAGRRNVRIRYEYTARYNIFKEKGLYIKPQSQGTGSKKSKRAATDEEDFDF